MDITKHQPTGPGALSGYQATCPKCGLELRSSMRTALEIDIAIHGDWHDGRDRLAPIPGPKGATR